MPPRPPARKPRTTLPPSPPSFVACGSLEMGAAAPDAAQRIAELLPAGTPVYVNHLPRRPLADALPALIALAKAGLEPVPHVAVRRIASRAEPRRS
jgi:methylenetetrahydrofolate reductase (NADPH)